jgi:hypothetical protein
MSTVSELSQDLFSDLVTWELLGDADIDPKTVLRQVPLSDLSVVRSRKLPECVCTTLIDLEWQYRVGQVRDWTCTRCGDKVKITYDVVSPPATESIPASA